MEPHKLNFRLRMLKTLRSSIQKYEDQITAALEKDLGKSSFEAYATETGLIYNELSYAIRRLRLWARPRRVGSPLVLWPAVSRVYPVPLGRVLIIAPWNYPFQLQIAPLIAAIAAGNRAILKPSELTPATADVIQKMISESFPRDYISVVCGEGAVVVPDLIQNESFDHIFFTGGTRTGGKIAAQAAEQHIPVTLELGGKSPAIVDSSADIANAAKSIIYGKSINAGQSCIAPDYLLIHQSLKDEFINEAKKTVQSFFPDGALFSPDYGRIINRSRFDFLSGLLKDGTVLIGGGSSTENLKIEPAVMENIDPQSPLLSDEIFGPILPLFTWETREELSDLLDQRPDPLALYLFTSSDSLQEYIFTRHSFGGGCVNDTMLHFANPALPFGGTGKSGRGNYHGKAGFITMSHMRSMVHSPRRFSLPFKFPPYTRSAHRIVRRFLR